MADSGISITRVFEASRDQLFTAWTTPEEYAQWLTMPPFTTSPDKISLDVRPGGKWRATLESDVAGELVFHGTYSEVVPSEKLVFSISDKAEETGETATITFNDLGGGKTEMVFEEGGGTMSADEIELAKQSWSGFFERLAAHVQAG